MRTSLMCLKLASDLELHNVIELAKFYRSLGPSVSDFHLETLVWRGITLALKDGGVLKVDQFWDELQSLEIISDPSKFMESTC